MVEIPEFTPLHPDGYRRTPWKNGGGVSIDIAGAARPGAEPDGWGGMLWRFARTRIATPAPFSDLSGYDRIIAVVAGRGLVLDAGAHGILDVREPFRPVRFPGEWAITSALEDGAVEVVNLIGDRAAVALDLRFLQGPASLDLAPGEHVVYAPTGLAALISAGEPVSIAADHSVHVRAPDPCRLDAVAGLVVVASIAPRPA